MSDKQFLPTDSGAIMVPFQPKNQFPEGWDAAEAIPMFGSEDKAAPVKKSLYPRWIRYKLGPNQDNSNYRQWIAKHFRAAVKEDMTDDSFNSYWDEVEKKYLNGDQILMVGDRKAVLGQMKYNWQSGNGRINRNLGQFANSRIKSPGGTTLAQNYTPEVEFHGAVAVFSDDEPGQQEK